MPEADEPVLDVGLVPVVDAGRGIQGELQGRESVRRRGSARTDIRPGVPVLHRLRERRGVRGLIREQLNHGARLSEKQKEEEEEET